MSEVNQQEPAETSDAEAETGSGLTCPSCGEPVESLDDDCLACGESPEDEDDL